MKRVFFCRSLIKKIPCCQPRSTISLSLIQSSLLSSGWDLFWRASPLISPTARRPLIRVCVPPSTLDLLGLATRPLNPSLSSAQQVTSCAPYRATLRPEPIHVEEPQTRAASWSLLESVPSSGNSDVTKFWSCESGFLRLGRIIVVLVTELRLVVHISQLHPFPLFNLLPFIVSEHQCP